MGAPAEAKPEARSKALKKGKGIGSGASQNVAASRGDPLISLSAAPELSVASAAESSAAAEQAEALGVSREEKETAEETDDVSTVPLLTPAPAAPTPEAEAAAAEDLDDDEE